jgi:hypothetical protein
MSLMADEEQLASWAEKSNAYVMLSSVASFT